MVVINVLFASRQESISFRLYGNLGLMMISIFSCLTAIIDFSLPHGNSSRLSRQHHHLFGLTAVPFRRYQTRQSLSSTAPSGFRQAAGPVDQRWCCFSCDAMQQRALCISLTLTQGFCSSVLVLLLFEEIRPWAYWYAHRTSLG